MKPIRSSRLLLAGAVALCAAALQAATNTYYVATNGNDLATGTSVSTPLKTIQAGVNKAAAGDTVLVLPGTYSSGYTTPTSSSKTRVAITKAITVRSTRGAALTTIVGGQHNITNAQPFGANSIRCVYMTAGTLDGFTLRDGFANASTIPADRDSPLINGGGVYVPKDNRTVQVNNCIITGCGAYRGGGAYWATLNNCTVVSNHVNTTSGDGIWGSQVRNSIVLYNGDENYSSASSSVDPSLFRYSCTDPIPTSSDYYNHDGGGNIVANPQFQTGTLRPASSSPCVNSGNNAYVDGGNTNDAAGNPRIIGGTVDMGAYENTYVAYALTVVNGTGSGSYTNHAVVAISANAPPAGSSFAGWTGDTAHLANAASASTTVTMPTNAVTVTANYQPIPFYTLTVTNGSGDGSYISGAVVAITADAAPAWATFDRWTGDTNHLANATNATTTVTMPTHAVTVTATYITPSLSEVVDGILNLPQPVILVNVGASDISAEPPYVRLGPASDHESAFEASISTVYTNAGTVIFPWRVSCEQGWDRLVFYVDGAEKASISGFDVSGVVTQFVADPGPHTLKWAYLKDDSAFDGEDCGWLMPVTWIPDILAAELGVAGKPLAFPNGQPGAALPFPYGFEACYLDTTNAPSGAISNAAVRLGGLKSGVPLVGDSRTNAVEAVLHGAGTLSFRWYSSCQDTDFLLCIIDGVEAARLSGLSAKTGGWKTFTTNLLTVAAHTVRWAYAKSPSGFTGQDCAWVDTVTWVQSAYVLTVQDALIVSSGLTNGTFAVGDVVAISASAAPAGMQFDEWDGDTENLADPDMPNTTVTMPGRDISVRALYKVQTWSLSIINGRDAGAWPNPVHAGTGEPEGTYPAGALVRIVADPAPLWQTFAYWTNTTGTVIYSNQFADISMFVMPAAGADVAIRAVYRDQTAAEKLAAALTIRGQPLVVTDFSTNGVVAEATGGIRHNDTVVRMGGPSVAPGQNVFLTTTNFTGSGYLLFWWHGDAEAEQDGIRLEVNGVPLEPLMSDKDTNSLVEVWNLYGYDLRGIDVADITWRYTSDDTYVVHENEVLVDRVTWIPEAMAKALDTSWFPNVNNEFDPLFEGRWHGEGTFDFEGEDGGVAWVHDAPGGGDAIRLGGFGYVTNNLLAQVSVTNWGTGILEWDWTTRSEARYDRLEFLLNGNPTNWTSGKAFGVWSNALFVVRTDPRKTRDENRVLKRVLTYRYRKDGDVSVFEDCGWMRNAHWTPTFALQLVDATNEHYELQSPYRDDPNRYAQVFGDADRNVFPSNSQVTVRAHLPPPSPYHHFERWTGSGASLLTRDQLRNSTVTFVMPTNDVMMVATYTTNTIMLPFYYLTVNNGAGSGAYTNGALVQIQANTPAAGKIFTGWTGNGTDYVVDVSSAATTVIMGTDDIELTATYSDSGWTIGSAIPFVIGVPNVTDWANVTFDDFNQAPPSVRLGSIGDNETAFFEVVYTNAGTVIFPWSVSCEQGYDFLAFSVDGIITNTISGSASGTVTNYVAGDGPHRLRWTYSKDGSDEAGTDSGSVGTVTWIPDELAAEFGVRGKPLHLLNTPNSITLEEPVAGAVSNKAARLGGPVRVVSGAETAVEAVYSGAGSLSFHWRTSSELNHDFLALSVDGVETERISGTRDGWVYFETNLMTVANHTVRWTYRKDGAKTAGDDCGWVDSVTWMQTNYVLTVQSGTIRPGGATNGTFAVADTVTVVANAAPANQEFDVWGGDTDALADPYTATTTLVMPSRDINIYALYKPLEYPVSMVKGREAGAWTNAVYEGAGEPQGSYPEGALVRVIANAAPLWKKFDHWSSTNGAVFVDASSPITMFTMPGNPVMVEATYINQSENEMLADALTIAGQPLSVTNVSPNGVNASATGGVRYNDPVVRLGGASVGPGGRVSLATTNFTGSGVLLYWWKSSSESRYDGVRLVVNGTPLGPVNSGKDTVWHLCTNWVTSAATIAWRFERDTSYYVRDNTILIDRVTWIPQAMLSALGGVDYVPNVNEENTGFSGEDGGVAWVGDAPPTNGSSAGVNAVRLGRFGYVNNSQHAQLSVKRIGTGILLWTWASCSEADYDNLIFTRDAYTNAWISGKEEAWESTGYAVTNILTATRAFNNRLQHTMNFSYKKDVDTSVFKDNAWLRDVSWTPTVMLYLEWATLNSYTLPTQFTNLQAVLDEVALGVYPQGTMVSVSAYSAPSGSAFWQWSGGPNIDAVLGANRFNSNPTFALPAFDFSMIATYTNIIVSPSPAGTKQSKITSLSVQPQAAAAPASGYSTLAEAAPAGWVELTFEGTSDADYALVWSPALVGPACQWQTVPASYREVLGETADGKRIFRISAEVPSDTPTGFFRVEAR